VRELFQRLIDQRSLLAYKYIGFWQCMDTLKDKQHLEELDQISAPWKVWQRTLSRNGSKAIWAGR
jgi:glucose-1-phosphate cytidylyltransferase